MENRESGWRRDKLGVIAPIGGGASWKEFFKISNAPAAVVANMLTRADLPAECVPYISLATSLAVYPDEKGERIIDPEHLIFCANVAGASAGKDGNARKQALMAQTNIIAPSVLAGEGSDNGRRKADRLDREQSKRQSDEDNE